MEKERREHGERLEHARVITERQLDRALREQKKTGKKLTDILMQDLSLQTIKDLFNYEIKLTRESRPKGFKEAMLESGLISAEELEELAGSEESMQFRIGEILLAKGVLDREKLGQALIESERKGQPLWRTIINMGFATAKQVYDAMKFEAPVLKKNARKDYLIEAFKTSEAVPAEKIEEIAEKCGEEGSDPGEEAVAMGLISAARLGEIMQRATGSLYIDLASCRPDPEAAHILPESFSRKRKVAAVGVEGESLVAAMYDPEDASTIDDMRILTGREIKPRAAATAKQVESFLDRMFGQKQAGAAEEAPPSEEGKIDELVESVSLVNLAASVIEGAINSEATDIHLEPQAGEMRVRYRIDGVLYDVMTVPKRVEQGLVSRMKILAGMDITQKRMPQDGHISMKVAGTSYDMRVATMPTMLGEKLVIRLLNPENVFLGLKQLGLNDRDLKKIDNLIKKPYGMFLAAGPIGSGKTTTLYAALNNLNVLTESIVTIEDPIEYELPGISQVQVDYKIHRTFANMLRAVLRQDVDTLLVGEIRDSETAMIATGAGMTGHLVFSTIHTNDAAGAVTRLIQLAVPRFLVSSSIIGICAQRLARKLCTNCRQEYSPDDAFLEESGLEGRVPAGSKLFKSRGCAKCYHTGYHGRTGIFEVLEVSDNIRGMILSHAPEAEIRKTAAAEGMSTLSDDAVSKVLDGTTSVEEIAAVMGKGAK